MKSHLRPQNELGRHKLCSLTQTISCKNWKLVILKYVTTHNHPKPLTTIHNHPKNHPQPSATSHNHPQLPKTIHKPSTTTQKTTHKHPQLPKKPPTTDHNHPEPPKNYSKKPRPVTNSYAIPFQMFILKQTLSFDSDTKQWYIYMCVYLCVYIVDKSSH